MSDIVNIVTAGGVGDCLQALQVADIIYKNNKAPQIHCAVRDEVFQPLQFLAKDLHVLRQIPEDTSYDDDVSEKYHVWPDKLFMGQFGFNYQKYNTTPELIKQNRVLLKKWKPEKIISLFLLSNTIGYSYYYIGELGKELAQALPDYQIYLPILTTWAGKKIPTIRIPPNAPQNLLVDTNPEFIENIKMAYRSHYCITADNAFSHICYNLGCRRLVLDSRFPLYKQSAPFFARWSENISDHISIENFPTDIAKLVSTNIKIEQTNLLPKAFTLKHIDTIWERDLLFKI